MQSVNRAAVDVAGIAMLTNRRVKKSGWEGAEFIRRLMPQDRKSSLHLAPPGASQIASQVIGLELDHYFQFHKGRNGYLRFDADRFQDFRTLRFRSKDLYQTA
jgi:hypothetical protein